MVTCSFSFRKKSVKLDSKGVSALAQGLGAKLCSGVRAQHEEEEGMAAPLPKGWYRLQMCLEQQQDTS